MSASSLLLLYGAATPTGPSGLLETLYGFGTSTSAGNVDPVVALTTAEANETKDVALEAKQPDVQRDIVAFSAAVAAAKSPADILGNPTALKVLLTANGLGDQLAYTALAQKTLLSNINDGRSLANTLSDTRWKSVVQTYDFANKGLSVIQNPTTIATITNGYAEVLWRQSLDATTPGLSNALTFRSEAGSITSVDQILGDPVLRTVVTVALGVPEEIAFQDLQAQEQAISTRLDIAQFKDPHFVETFAQRYLVAAASTASSGGATTDLTTLAIQAQGLVV
jgi:hypothetical protein